MKDRDALGRDPFREARRPFRAEVEEAECRSVAERPEETRDGAAEAARLDEAQPVFRPDRERVRIAPDVVENVAVRVDDALGTAGRSGRVEDVRAVLGRDGEARAGVGGRRERVLDGEEVATVSGKLRGERAMSSIGEEESGARLRQRLLEARARVRAVERHVELARLESPENRRDERRALGEQERDRLFVFRRAPLAQDRVGDAVGRRVDFAVAPAPIAGPHGRPAGRLGHPRLEPGGERLLDLLPRELAESGARTDQASAGVRGPVVCELAGFRSLHGLRRERPPRVAPRRPFSGFRFQVIFSGRLLASLSGRLASLSAPPGGWTASPCGRPSSPSASPCGRLSSPCASPRPSRSGP